MSTTLAELLEERYGPDLEVPAELDDNGELLGIAAHRSHRSFTADAVPDGVLDTLFACAFSAPSKSDLQQACVVRVRDPDKHAAIAALIPSMPWIAAAPVFLVFCGDNRRIRRICRLRGKPFGNDHLDSFFNASVDAGLVLMNFIRAAEAAGLGCCPISAVRNHVEAVSELLELPDNVFPVAGLVAGRPAQARRITPRLGLACSVHTDRYDDSDLEHWLDEYDRRRHRVLPLAGDRQRDPDRFGEAAFYGWSEDKARQVARTERDNFGPFVRGHGFRLD